jgi:hypothetical protein
MRPLNVSTVASDVFDRPSLAVSHQLAYRFSRSYVCPTIAWIKSELEFWNERGGLDTTSESVSCRRIESQKK